MVQKARHGLRILVGAGTFADANAALRIVAQFPTRFCASLGGVLVDEIDTLATGQTPDRRIVMLSGATTFAPNPRERHTLVQADARAFRQSIARTADPDGTQWVFAQDQGELIATSLRAAVGWDILILGYRQINKLPGKIILLEAAGQTNTEMVEAFNRLSQYPAADRVVFSVGTDPAKNHDTAQPNTFRFDTLDECLRRVTRTNADAVLIDLKNGPIRTQNDLARLLDAARCPLIVFGPSSTDSLLEHNTQIPPAPINEGQTSGG